MAVGKKDYKDSQVRLKHKQKVPPQTLVKVEPSSDDTRTRAELLDAIEDLFQTVYTSTGASREVDLEDLRAILTMLVLSATNADDDGVGATQTQVDAINLNSTNIARNASDLATFITNISISNNKIGIGTTSPLKNFEVEWISNNTVVDSGEGLGGGAAGSGVLIQNGSYVTNTYANLDFRAGTADGRIAYKYNSINNGDFHFITDDGNNPETKLFIKNNGKVGIGTTSPSQGLHVVDAGIITSEFESSDNVSSLIEVSNNAGLDVFFGVYGGNLVLRHDDYTADHFAIDSSGNVGIGTASPSATLHISDASNSGVTSLSVNDRVKVRGDGVVQWGSAANYGLLSWDTNQARVGALSGSNLAIFSNGSEKMRIDTSGNVGIGTTSPHNKAHITSSGNQDGLLLDLSTGSNGDYTGVYFKVDNNTTNTYKKGGLVWERTGSYNEGRFHFLLNNEDNTNNVDLTDSKLTILSTGNVGIGTTSPVSELDVNGTITLSGDTEHRILKSTSSSYGLGGAETTFVYGRNVMLSAYDDVVLRAGTSDEIRFFAGSSGAARMTIDRYGNVGVGTASPGAKLHITPSTTIGWSSLGNAGILIGTDTGAGIGIDQNEIASKGDHLYLGTIDANKDLVIRTGGATHRLVVKGDTGKVGIGTSSPSEKLEVDGRIKLQTSAGSLTMKEAGAGSVALASSATIVMEAPSNFRLNTGPSLVENFTVLSTGNVGIGTTSPSEKLEVTGNIKTSGNLTVATDIIHSGDTDTMIRFTTDNIRLQAGGNNTLELDGANATFAGNISLTGSVQKQIQVFPMNFVDDLGTDKHFMPFVTANEQTANYQEEACMVMPADGRVVSVTVHYAQMHGAASDITVGIETSSCGQSYTNAWTIEETETISASADDDHHVFHFAFDNAKHFESTDKMALSIQQSVDLQNANRFFWVTAVIEYDWSTFLGGTSAEYGTTP